MEKTSWKSYGSYCSSRSCSRNHHHCWRKETLAAVPESVQGVANIVRETGFLLTTSVKGMNFVLENFIAIGTALGVGFVGYKSYTK